MVQVVIFYQGSNNRTLFERQLKVTVEKPYFIASQHKVFVLYDPPHLIKNMGNNLEKNPNKHGFNIDGQDVAWHVFSNNNHGPCVGPCIEN